MVLGARRCSVRAWTKITELQEGWRGRRFSNVREKFRDQGGRLGVFASTKYMAAGAGQGGQAAKGGNVGAFLSLGCYGNGPGQWRLSRVGTAV